jgi:two-component system response regulator AtoC
MGSVGDGAKPAVLLVSNGDAFALAHGLFNAGVTLSTTRNGREAFRLAASAFLDAILLDEGTEPERESPDFGVAQWCQRWPDVPLIACGPDDDALARRALTAGACSYLTLPASDAMVTRALETALGRGRTASASLPLGSKLLGESPLLAAVREKTARLATGRATVLVRGETGTGKEVVARDIHAQSQRCHAPFLPVHAAAVPDALLESELFGYEKGAFTGASVRKPGRVELAAGGTLFFDEIGDVSPAIQVKLLRLIQDREYDRLGGTRTQRADVRIIAATHRDLEDMTARGTFREDLFYRLNVVTVWVPPLRARREDIAAIAQHYLAVFRGEYDKPRLALEATALELLRAQRWPGNVRQLVNLIERLVVLARGNTIDAEDVRRELDDQREFLTQANGLDGLQALGIVPPVEVTAGVSAAEPSAVDAVAGGGASFGAKSSLISSVVRPLREEIRRAELRALTKALRSAGGNRALAARMLGISRRTLYTKLEELGI